MAHQPKVFKKESITVAFLVEKLVRTVGVQVAPVNDVSGEDRMIVETTLHRPGLALAGYVELFTFQRVQIVGNTENQYLDYLSLNYSNSRKLQSTGQCRVFAWNLLKRVKNISIPCCQIQCWLF